MRQTFQTILFLDLTETKRYSSQTRAFLFTFDSEITPSEHAIVATLQNPDKALSEAEKHATTNHAKRDKLWRRVGMGVGAVAGGVLIGVTGGLAAPLVGAGVASVLGVFGVGGTAAGMLVTGLASSSAVTGALFSAYGAQSSAMMVSRYTASVVDFEFLRVGDPRQEGDESLAINLCVSGWVESDKDVTDPWTIFDLGIEHEETFALKWVWFCSVSAEVSLIAIIGAKGTQRSFNSPDRSDKITCVQAGPRRDSQADCIFRSIGSSPTFGSLEAW